MKKTFLLSLQLLFTAVSLFSFTSAFSATIKGHIKDAKNGEELVGATVYLKENNQVNAVAGLDGSYVLKDVQPGKYTLVVNIFSYATQEKSITVANASDEITENFTMQPDSTTLNEVQITGAYNAGSDNYARSEEKNSDVVMNIVSAKTIQMLPDYTIGDVLQRVSGVTTEKSVTGGGEYAVVRGMDGRYNYTTIDGVKIPSPDYKNSYVPMDIFPSEMVERLEVIKTLTPDMEGSAIGGAVNLVLKEAPDHFILTANVAGGFSENLLNHGFETFNTSVINSQSPNQINGPNYGTKASDFPLGATTVTDKPVLPNTFAGFTIGNRFLGGKFGVLASFNYQNTYSLSNGFFIKPQSQPDASLAAYNIPDWDYIQSRETYVQQTRGAGHLMMDYIFNKKNKITLYNVYAQMTQVETRIADDTDNATPGSELDPNDRFQVTNEYIYNATLKGTDTLAHNLALDWTTAYSRAWSTIPDWNDLSLDGTFGSPVIDFSGLTTRWIDNTEQDFSGYVNLTYSLKLFGQNVSLKAGAMNRDKTRDAYYAEYDINSAPIPNQQVYTGMGEIFSNPHYYTFADTTGSPGSANSYTVQEDVNAYYGMLKFTVGPHIDIIGGERIENTNEAYQTQLSALTIADAYGEKQYTDYLPSVEIKFRITDKQSIHASFFESIARPNLYDIVPYQLPGDYYTEIGNPNLLHTQANNYDLRYEFFPSPSDEILAGVFYKQIYNAIENAVVRGTGPSAVLLQPTNIGGDTNPAINYGFEFQFIKKIRKFEISGNYAYTHSSITVPEQEYYENASGYHTISVNETRPLQGQANDVANLAVAYEEPKIGLKLEVTGVYTGREISAVNIWYEMDQWQMPMTTLAFSFEKRLSKKIHLSLYGKINNILNTPLLIEMFPPSAFKNDPTGAGAQTWLPDQTNSDGYLSSIIMQKESYGQSYLLGLRYTF